MEFSISILNSTHKKENFKCDRESLDDYIKKQAKQDAKRSLSVCYVLEDRKRVVKGYFTLSSASIPREGMPETMLAKLPKGYADFPATLLGRLALDNTVKGQKLGSALLYAALKKALVNSGVIASLAVIVDPLDEALRSFYSRYEFIGLPGSGRMFLPMATIKKLVEQETSVQRGVIMDRTEEALKVIRELSGQVRDISMLDLNNLVASKSPSRMIELEADQPNRATEMLSQIRAVLADHKPGIRHAVMLVSEGLEHPCTIREHSILIRGFVEVVGSDAHLVKSFLETDQTLEGGLIVRLLLWTD